jgi:O-antigen ligase
LYLEIAAERGVFGLIVFGAIIFFTFRQVNRASKKFLLSGNTDLSNLAIAMGISLVTYLISSIFLHDSYPRFFWVLVGICWAMPQSAQYLIVQSKTRVFHQ